MNQAQSKLAYLTSDDLKDLLNDETKIEDRVDEVVSALALQLLHHFFLFIILFIAKITGIGKGHNSGSQPKHSRRESKPRTGIA